ncbi:MAG: flagellar basal body L-ring protein FlgH [Chthoniobacterales bacterium]|nr:flagellar basal body L-ring protein FlgH [Chthoniobacterales bacterium]
MKVLRILLFLTSSLSLFLNLGFAQSLWLKDSNTEQSMYADARARNVGDILTIVVQESATTTQETQLKTNDATQNGLGVFINGLLNQFLAATPALIKQWTGAETTYFPNNSTVTIPTVDLAAKSEWTGGGQTSSRLSVNNRTAVTVVDVLPNGNLVVEGAKIIRSQKETLYAYMRGVVRQRDIRADNTVLSTQIADAHVEFIPEGELTEAERKGWLLRAWERIKPF